MKTIKFRGKDATSKQWVYGGFHLHNRIQLAPFGRTKEDIEKNMQYLILKDSGADWNLPKDIEAIEVIPETVGQFTGILSKNHKTNILPEIYEDDLFRQTKETNNGDITAYLVVMWIEQLSAFYLVPIEHYEVIKGNDVSTEREFSWLFNDAELRDFSIDVGLTKVGNIHDNPELLINNE